jgi:hypothetical protein
MTAREKPNITNLINQQTPKMKRKKEINTEYLKQPESKTK